MLQGAHQVLKAHLDLSLDVEAPGHVVISFVVQLWECIVLVYVLVVDFDGVL